MAPPHDVCIRGAGVVGRTLALLLARDGLRVALVARPEPSGEGASDVRAYAMNVASRELLESLRSWPDPQHATAVRAMEVAGDDGGRVHFTAPAARPHEGDHGRAAEQALAWIVDVPALLARLGEAVRFQPLVDLVAEPVAAPLTVVCEGRASSTRQEFHVDFETTAYHQRAIAARVRCEIPHGSVARQWFDQGEVLAFLPLDGAAGNSVALVWSADEAHAAALMALDDAGFEQALHAASHGALGRATLIAPRAAWPLLLSNAHRWVGRLGQGAWALAGDAAHTVHPLAGQGLNLGLADARELASVLRGRESWRGIGDEKLLRRYERARKAGTLAMAAATDGLQRMFAPGGGALRALRNWGMRGFDRSGPVKGWVARQAMGLR